MKRLLLALWLAANLALLLCPPTLVHITYPDGSDAGSLEEFRFVGTAWSRQHWNLHFSNSINKAKALLIAAALNLTGGVIAWQLRSTARQPRLPTPLRVGQN